MRLLHSVGLIFCTLLVSSEFVFWNKKIPILQSRILKNQPSGFLKKSKIQQARIVFCVLLRVGLLAYAVVWEKDKVTGREYASVNCPAANFTDRYYKNPDAQRMFGEMLCVASDKSDGCFEGRRHTFSIHFDSSCLGKCLKTFLILLSSRVKVVELFTMCGKLCVYI